MDDVCENDQCLFFVGVTIILMAESKKELKSVCETVETIGKRNSYTIDASFDKLDNLAMDVQIDKEKRAENENAKAHEETAREDIEKFEPVENKPERVEAEIVYAPMVAETHEYQYNADAFEARGSANMKAEAPKEVPLVRTEKAR